MKKITLMIASALLIFGTQAFADDADGNGNPTGAAVGTAGLMPKGAQVCECNLNPSGILKTKTTSQFDSAMPDNAGTPGSATPANGAGGTK